MSALSIPKVKVASFVCQPLRDAARGAPCMVLSPWCSDNRETTVLAHSDALEDGNGWGCKGHDADAFACCFDCHRYIGEARQGTEEERSELKRMAHKRWWRWLVENKRIQFVKRRA